MRANHLSIFIAVLALGLGCWGNKKDKKKEKAKDDVALASGSERELTRDEALRERPDLGDVPVVARVSAGTKLDIVEMKEAWVKVRSKDGQAQGWLPKEALVPLPKLPETSAAEATAATGTPPEATGATAPASGGAAVSPTAAAPETAPASPTHVVKWPWVRMRKTPDGEIAGRLTEGMAVETSARERVKNKEWVKISATQGEKTVTGWVAAAALTTAKSTAKKAEAKDRSAEKATVKGSSPTPASDEPTVPGGSKRFAKRDSTPRSTAKTSGESADTERDETIKWSTVRLRSAPSTKSKVLADMPQGTKVTVVKSRGEWLKVNAHLSEQDATTGWVIAKSTKAKDARDTESVTSTARTADSETETKKIVWKYVNLRSKPSTSTGKILAKWDKGFAVKVVATDGDWTRVRARARAKMPGARVGWIKSAALGDDGNEPADAPSGAKRKVRAEKTDPSRDAMPDRDRADIRRGKTAIRAMTLAKSAVATTHPDTTSADDDASEDAAPRKVAKPEPARPKTKVSLIPDAATKGAATLPLPSDSKKPAPVTQPARAAQPAIPAATAIKPDKGVASIGWPVVQIRDEPDGRIVGELKRGARVTELARDGEWVKVRSSDTTGWIVDQALAKP
ncbi:MAG: SH3 domain-containing protein [Deltaproteobacteria bacterium]|nr:SH3 domain-containing protein [Deltaproteobacteria bacterium]